MTAYYNQEYHEPVDPDPVPQSNWKQILKETFLRPFTWNARTSRRTYWIGFAILVVLSLVPTWYLIVTTSLQLMFVNSSVPMEYNPTNGRDEVNPVPVAAFINIMQPTDC